jgi:hypothetical protein
MVCSNPDVFFLVWVPAEKKKEAEPAAVSQKDGMGHGGQQPITRALRVKALARRIKRQTGAGPLTLKRKT